MRGVAGRIVNRVLAVPLVYRVWGWLVGGGDRGAFAREYVRAREGQRVLDIGCGPADVLQWLPRVDYTGFDSNPDYIRSATSNYGDRGRFYCQRVSEQSLSDHRGFDIVLALGVLHHLDDDEAERLFRLALAALVPGGRLLTLDGVFVKGQNPIARLIISHDRGEHVRDEAGYRALAGRVFAKVKPAVRTDLNRIPYTHIIMECEK